MSRPRGTHALGEQSLHLVKVAGDKAREIERRALRRKVETASQRPAPGTSELLSGAGSGLGVAAGIDRDGRLRAVDTHDLVGMAPIHLKGHKGIR